MIDIIRQHPCPPPPGCRPIYKLTEVTRKPNPPPNLPPWSIVVVLVIADFCVSKL